MEDIKGTIRQQIIALLKIKPMDAYSLSGQLRVKQRSIEEHLEHVSKSIGENFEILPSRCNDCDFIFLKRDRVTKPTGCPKCMSESILPPAFFIKTEPENEN
jgi:predicted Zn-ribbon and HTH transcriptional regulator